MKKMLYCLVIANLVVLFIGMVWQFSNENGNRPFEGKTAISIEKDKHIASHEHLAKLEKIATRLSTDIMYNTYDLTNEKYVNIFYTTRNNGAFLNLPIEGNIHDSEVFSTKRETSDARIYGVNLVYDYEIRDMSQLEAYSLDRLDFYVDSTLYRKWQNELKENNINYTTYTMEQASEQQQPVSKLGLLDLVQIIMLICLSIGTLVYIFSCTKEIAIAKLNGCCFWESLEGPILVFVKILVLSGISFLLLAATVLLYWDIETMILFLISSWKTMTIALSVFSLGYLLFAAYVFFDVSTKSIKGEDRNTLLFIFVNCAKVIILAVLVINTSSILNSYQQLDILNQENLRVNKLLKDYAYTTLSSESYDPLIPGEAEKFNEKALQFYHDTVERFHGVIMDNSGYYLRGDFDHDSEARKVTINQNYLDINPILGSNGEYLRRDDFDNEKLNIIISEIEDEKAAVSQYIESINYFEGQIADPQKVVVSDINVIKYDQNSSIYGLNPTTNKKYFGELKQPIIYMFDDQYQYHQNMIVLYSNGAYLIRSPNGKVEQDLLPYINKHHLENAFYNISYLSNAFSDSISTTSNTVIMNLGLLALYGFPLLILTIYFANLYCRNDLKSIVVKRINGCSFFSCHWKAFVWEIIMLLLNIALLVKANLNFEIFTIVAVVDLVMLVVGIHYFERKNMPEFLKGRQ